MTPTDIRHKILTMAARPQGVSRQDLQQHVDSRSRPMARAIADQLEASGELLGAFHPQQKRTGLPKTRLFAKREHLTAWCNGPFRPGVVQIKPTRAEQREKLQAKAAPIVRQARQPLPVLPAKVQTEPRITGKTKVTIAPVFVDRRFVPDVVPRVVDPEQCSGWARAATERRA